MTGRCKVDTAVQRRTSSTFDKASAWLQKHCALRRLEVYAPAYERRREATWSLSDESLASRHVAGSLGTLLSSSA